MKVVTFLCDVCRKEMREGSGTAIMLTPRGSAGGSGPKYDVCDECSDTLTLREVAAKLTPQT